MIRIFNPDPIELKYKLELAFENRLFIPNLLIRIDTSSLIRSTN